MTVATPTRNWPAIVQQLEQATSPQQVVKHKEELLVYECDGLTSYRQPPAAVVFPRTTEEVAATVKICDRHNVPFVARGSGTGLSGGSTSGGRQRADLHRPHAANPQH